MAERKVNYREKFLKNIFTKDIYQDDEKKYISHRLSINVYYYFGSYQNKEKKEVNYEWYKIKISNQKLEQKDWMISIKQKVIDDKRIISDETFTVLKLEDFIEIANYFINNFNEDDFINDISLLKDVLLDEINENK